MRIFLDSGVVTGPLPLAWLFDHFCPDWIENNIPAQFQYMGILFNDYGLEAALENMANQIMASVESLSVNTI